MPEHSVILPDIAAQSLGGAGLGETAADSTSRNNAAQVAAAAIDACDMHVAAEAAGLTPPDGVLQFNLAAWLAYYEAIV